MTTAAVRNLLADIVGADLVVDLTDDGLLLEDGLIDSMHLVELVTRLETELGVAIDADDLVPEHFESINAIAAFLDARSALR